MQHVCDDIKFNVAMQCYVIYMAVYNTVSVCRQFSHNYHFTVHHTPMLKDLHTLVTPEFAISWRNIGSALGLTNGLLDIIEYDHHNKAEDCCNAVWEQWLDMDSTATWNKVFQVIAAQNTLCVGMDDETHGVIFNVSNQMQRYYIEERYKISEDDWPPYQPDHFTSVALIHHKDKHRTVREVIEVAQKMHRGSVKVDDTSINSLQKSKRVLGMVLSNEYTLGCPSTKDISEIFIPIQDSNGSSATPNVILIEGATGIGKTILSKEIAFRWANKSLLTNKVLLFLIFLRDPYIKNIKSLKEFVAYAICSSLQNRKVDLIVEYLEITSGADVTIVLDGYDEVSSEVRNNSFVAKIINRRILRLCGLVITSRPTASTNLHGNVDRRVEILGFTKEDRMKYVRQSLKDNRSEIEQLEAYLEKNPFINSLCYIPLNMTILMCIFKAYLGNPNYTLPKTQTEINDQFICITISRYLRKTHSTPLIIKSLSELPAPYKQHFKNLSNLAFELLSKDQVVFNDNDMKECPNWSDLGLLKVVKYSEFLRDTPVLSYNFLHFTLQEFLAAHYVTSLPTRKQINILKDHFWENRYLNSWVMYVGLTNGDSFALKHFLTGRRFILLSLIVRARGIADETIIDKMKCLYLFQCFFEAGNSKMCDQVGNCLVDAKIDLSNTTLLPKDMHTLCFFLARSTTKQWKLLDLSNCYIGDDGCDILATMLVDDGKTNFHINKMDFSINNLTSKSIDNILRLVQYFKIQELIVTGNTFNGKTFADVFFTNIIQHKLFHKTLLSVKTNTSYKLSVYVVNCKESLTSQVKSYVCSDRKIYSFYFWNTSFKADDLLILFSNVHIHSSIELNVYKDELDSQILSTQSELQKTINRITGEGNCLDVFALHLIKFSYILVSQRQVRAYNADHSQIIQIIKHSCSPSIEVLNLTCCYLYSELVCTIGNILSIDFREIKFIDLSECNMEDLECDHFCKVLFSNTSVVRHLEEFNLSCNKLTSACVISLAESLKHCTIRKLIIAGNDIQEDAFRDVLKDSCTLLNSEFETTLLVINDIINLQSEVEVSGNFSCFADVYVIGCDNMDICSSFHCLPTSDHGILLYRVIFFSCSSLLTVNFGEVTSMLDSNQFLQIEFLQSDLTENMAKDCATKLDEICYCYSNLKVKYIITSDTKLLTKNCRAEELKELSLKLKSLTTVQLTGCTFRTDTMIAEILSDINIYNCLHFIDLSRCNIGDNGCSALCNFFGNFKVRYCIMYIKVLNLSYNSLTSASILCLVNLLQCCVVEKLILSNNHISNDDFNQVYFKSKYSTYANSSSHVPLVLINSENSDSVENFAIYFVNLSINKRLICILNSLTANNELTGLLFLVNTNLQVDCFNKILSLLQIRKMLKLVIVEGNLKNDVATFVMKSLKILLHERQFSDCKTIQYFLQSKSNLWTNSINETIISHILTSTQVLPNDRVISNDSFLVEMFKCKQWDTIDLSNCNIGEDGFKRLLYCFASLKHGSSINAFNISNNNLSLNSAENIAKLIVCLELKEVVISHNKLEEGQVADALVKMYSESNTAAHTLTVKIVNNNHAAVVTYNSSDILINETSVCPQRITYFAMTNCDLYTNDDDDDGDIIDHSCDDHDHHIDDYEDNNHNHDNHDQNVYDTSKSDQLDQFQETDKTPSQTFKNANHITLQTNDITTNSDESSVTFELQQYSSLSHFEISKCNIQETKLLKLFNTLEGTSTLQTLILNSINITNNLASLIARVINDNLNLEKLSLTDCYLVEVGMEIILAAMNQLSSLKCIDLSSPKCKQFVQRSNVYCYTPSKEVLSFSLLLSVIGNNNFLEHLNISNCKANEDELIEIAKSMPSFLLIKHLNISGNNITDSVSNHMAHAIRSNPGLECISVSNCCLSEHGLIVIFNALSDLNGLLHIDISMNRIGGRAAKELTNTFSKNMLLTYLSVHKCDLNVEDCIKIMTSLKKHNFLAHLDFSGNETNDDIAFTLPLIISNNPALKYLDISHCNVTEQGIKLIANSLKCHCGLKHFNARNNYMNHSSAKHISSALASNRSLEYLDISDCGFMDFRIIDLWLCKHFPLKRLVLRSNTPFQTYRNYRNTNAENTDTIKESVHSCIEHLDISGCNLSGIQLISTAKHLQTVSTLKYLDISNNKVSNSLAVEIAAVILSNPFLETLIFSCCDLPRSKLAHITKAMRTISTLKHLDFSENILTSNEESDIGSVIIHNPFLEHLNLSSCTLSEIQITSIAKALSKMSRLKYLDISYNEINHNASIDIASVITNSTSLQHLNLSGCNLKETAFEIIANSLRNIKSLTSIDMSNNFITYKTAQSIAVAFSNNLDMEQLNFCNCLMNDTAALIILNAISHHKAITHLCLRSNVITNDMAKLISALLSRNNNIKHLDLGQCKLQEYGFLEILDGLTNTTTLHYLSLEFNVVSKDLIIVGVASIIQKNASLKDLILSNCNFPKLEIQTVFHAITQISSIKHLDVSGNVIANCACVGLKDALSKNNRIEHLDVSKCKIDDEGLYNVLIPLTACKHLKHLNLCSSVISNESASELLPIVIADNKSLSHLDLTDCNLQEVGLVAVAKSLQTTGILKTLCLSCNRITNAAAYEIASAIRMNHLLQHLTLSDCGLQELGLIDIAESLCTILSLKHLDLSRNVITDGAASSVALGVANNATMQYLDLRFCKWQDSGVTIFYEVADQMSMMKFLIDNYETLW